MEEEKPKRRNEARKKEKKNENEESTVCERRALDPDASPLGADGPRSIRSGPRVHVSSRWSPVSTHGADCRGRLACMPAPIPLQNLFRFVSFPFLRWRASRVPNLTLSPSGSAAVSPAIAKEGMDLAPPLNFLFYNFSIIYYDFLKIQRK